MISLDFGSAGVRSNLGELVLWSLAVWWSSTSTKLWNADTKRAAAHETKL